MSGTGMRNGRGGSGSGGSATTKVPNLLLLAHFCEVDGPRIVFCTQAVREGSTDTLAERIRLWDDTSSYSDDDDDVDVFDEGDYGDSSSSGNPIPNVSITFKKTPRGSDVSSNRAFRVGAKKTKPSGSGSGSGSGNDGGEPRLKPGAVAASRPPEDDDDDDDDGGDDDHNNVARNRGSTDPNPPAGPASGSDGNPDGSAARASATASDQDDASETRKGKERASGVDGANGDSGDNDDEPMTLLERRRRRAAASTGSTDNQAPTPPRMSATPKRSSPSRRPGKAPKASFGCPSCASIGPDASFVTLDEYTDTHYVSRASPERNIFTMAQEKCLLSLTHELCPGMEGPILFGSHGRGFALSHHFKLADAKARGQQRTYALIVLVDDRSFLVSSWNFLTKHLKGLVVDLQLRASRARTQEAGSAAAAVSGRSFSFRSSNSYLMHRRHGNVPSSQRSLATLLGLPDLFATLHGRMAWILRGAQRSYVELNSAPNRVLAPSLGDESCGLNTEDDSLDFSVSHPGSSGGGVVSPRSSGIPLRLPDTLSGLAQLLGADDTGTILFNLIIGNQVVVRCDMEDVAASLMDVLRRCILTDCCSTVNGASEYQDRWRCNFLGISHTVRIPAYLAPDSIVLVDVSHGEGAAPLRRSNVHEFRISVIGDCRETTLGKQLLFLCSRQFPRRVETTYLNHIKSEWTNKAKVFFNFAKTQGLTNEGAVETFVKAMGLVPADVPVLRFWMSGLPKAFRTSTLARTSSAGGSGVGASPGPSASPSK